MPQKYRLSGEEIRNLTGKRLHGRLFSLLIAPIPGAHVKSACVVSKKVAKNAPDRNVIKRRVRSIVAKRVETIGKPRALVFYAKKDAPTASFADIEHDIVQLLEKVG